MIYDMTTNIGPYNESVNIDDPLYGSAAMALIEFAQNDYAIFKAMLECDARELGMRRDGTLNESNIQLFNEAVASGLGKKIVGFLRAALEKILEMLSKASSYFKYNIKANILANQLSMIGDKVKESEQITNPIKITWRRICSKYSKNNEFTYAPICRLEVTTEFLNKDAVERFIHNHINANNTEILSYFIDSFVSDVSNRDYSNITTIEEYNKFIYDSFWEDESVKEYTVESIGGIYSIAGNLNHIYTYITEIDKYSNTLKKLYKDLESLFTKADGGESPEYYATGLKTVNVINQLNTIYTRAAIQYTKDVYKQYAAAAKKCIAALKAAQHNDNNTEEDTTTNNESAIIDFIFDDDEEFLY